MPRLLKSFGHEIQELLPVWAFFFLAFALLRLTQSVMLERYGLHLTTPSLVLLASFIVAKAFLIIDFFPFARRFDRKPLIYGVLWKTGIYFFGAVVVYAGEQFIEILLRTHRTALARSTVASFFTNRRFGIIAIWLLLLLFTYSAARATILAIGTRRFTSLWFGERGNHSRTRSKKAA